MTKRCIISVFVVFCFSILSAGERTVLRTEFQDITPKFIINSDGTYTGLSYDLAMMIQRKSGIQLAFDPDPVPISRVSLDLERGLIDVQIGLQKSPEREKVMIFGEPLYTVRTIALVRADDDPDFSSLKDLVRLGHERGMVLTIWGTGISQILRSVDGLALDDGAKSVEDAIHKLLLRRGRVLIYHNLSLIYLLNNSENRDRVKIIPLDYGRNRLLEDSSQYVVFSKKADPEIVRRINRAVKECRQSGELDRITSRYLK